MTIMNVITSVDQTNNINVSIQNKRDIFDTDGKQIFVKTPALRLVYPMDQYSKIVVEIPEDIAQTILAIEAKLKAYLLEHIDDVFPSNQKYSSNTINQRWYSQLKRQHNGNYHMRFKIKDGGVITYDTDGDRLADDFVVRCVQGDSLKLVIHLASWYAFNEYIGPTWTIVQMAVDLSE